MTGLAIPSVGRKGELDQLDQLAQLGCCFSWQSCAAKRNWDYRDWDIFFRRQALKEECDDRVKNYQEALIDQRATQLCIAFGWSIDLVDSGVEQYHTPHPVVLSRLTVSKPIHNFNFFGIEP
jgi:hypothetical protein